MISILQPFIPHYRLEFFEGLAKQYKMDIYCYDLNYGNNNNFSLSSFPVKELVSWKLGPFLFYNPFVFLKKEYSTLVLMLDFCHISTWFLLFTSFFHKKKIVLWGQGISVKRFMYEEYKPNILLKWMIKLSNVIWFYTENEKKIWEYFLKGKNFISLNNTISGVDSIVNIKKGAYDDFYKSQLKLKYSINQKFVLIYCARFDNPYRNIDSLVFVIENVKSIGFIIIGDGKYKPDFSNYPNVYDFGSLYNIQIKKELFCVSDLYFQPGWVGLSIVEALSYGKPVITLNRSLVNLQCVEFSYLIHGFNSFIFNDSREIIEFLEDLSNLDLKLLSENCISFVSSNLTMKKMIENASSSLNL